MHTHQKMMGHIIENAHAVMLWVDDLDDYVQLSEEEGLRIAEKIASHAMFSIQEHTMLEEGSEIFYLYPPKA